jgi:hypothetical protein
MDSTILQILIKHNLAPSIEMIAAMRDVYAAGASSVAQSTVGGDNTDDAEDEGAITPMTAYDIAALKQRGIDPNKKFRIKNSLFTVTGWKPSRPKFPISGVNQNGRRFKFSVATVVQYQRAS